MVKNIIYICLSLSVLYLSCDSRSSFEGIDLKEWRSDKNGCGGKRLKMLETLLKARLKLKGISQNEMLSVLGTPDKQELTGRNQKYFIYYLEASEKCHPSSSPSNPKILQIRFNAVSYANEVLIKEFQE